MKSIQLNQFKFMKNILKNKKIKQETNNSKPPKKTNKIIKIKQ